MPIIFPDLPQLSEQAMGRVLAQVKLIMKEVCGVDVNLAVSARRDAHEFIAEQQRRIAPYNVPVPSLRDVLVDSESRCRRALREQGQRPIDLDLVRGLLQTQEALQVKDRKTAEEMLIQHHVAGIARIRKLKRTDGKPLVDLRFFNEYSASRWGFWLHSMDWSDGYTLYITNGLLIDDVLDWPESLAANALINGWGLPASRTAIVGYHAVLADELRAGSNHLPVLSEDEKEKATAYIAAKLLEAVFRDCNVSLRADGGLPRPIWGLKSKEEFLRS